MGAKDITEKILADYEDVFADIINGVLFDGEQVLHENELVNVKDKSQYKFDNKIHEQERDVCKQWVPYGVCFALVGLEHETQPEPYMPMRIIGYDGAAYRGQLTKSEKEKPNYPVITLVLYFGMKHWNKPRTLFECMDIPERLKPFVNDYKIHIVEVAFLNDRLHYFHSDFRIIAEYFINKRTKTDYVPSAQEIRHMAHYCIHYKCNRKGRESVCVKFWTEWKIKVLLLAKNAVKNVVKNGLAKCSTSSMQSY